MHLIWDPLLLFVAWTHVYIAPYTKVEESFNLHAIHDVLMYGIVPAEVPNYDHFTFPGAVPRTFIGSVLLSWVSTPVMIVANRLGFIKSKADLQIMVRLVLATINAIGLCVLRRTVARRFGPQTGIAFTLLTCSQFHVPFWMGRTLPNMFALFPVNMAYFCLLPRTPKAKNPSRTRIYAAIVLLTFTSVVFRSEVAALLAPIVIQALLQRQVDFVTVVLVGLISGLASIILTIMVDSYFWDQFPLWPEFSAIFFNVYQGKSSEWGVSPPLTYFTTHLPKLLLSSLPLSVLGVIVSPKARPLVLSSLAFVGLISFLGHKEWRFVVYVVPPFNIAAAAGVQWLLSRRGKGFFVRWTFILAVAGMLSLNLAATVMSTAAASQNYPGGQAMELFHHIYKFDRISRFHVHISNLAAQTGASLFQQLNAPPYPPVSLCSTCHPPVNYLPELLEYPDYEYRAGAWAYNKTENLRMQEVLGVKAGYTHLILEQKPPVSKVGKGRPWEEVEVIKGFQGWTIDLEGVKELVGKSGNAVGADRSWWWWPLKMRTEAMLYILKRNS
ncbi:alpha-1,6-mannosyltransferase subunit [Pluteus cervinus]|uniref:Alpha-1,6-mannosyltransferase subunit n=1 Tax=Pluteus cervinus TaxID=181527 RepID=A0ACD3B0E7_9AGAR|nr:alpha-1,6-mannosyltransferase subunit [Pluteus cervinus]